MRNNKQNRFIVLMYHKVGESSGFLPALDTKVFRRQISFLKRFYDIVSLEGIFNPSSNGSKKTKAIITFDDGYRSIYKYAYPVLRKYNIPATVFLTANSIEKNTPIWPDLVSHCIQVTKKDSVDLESTNGKVNFSLDSIENKIKAVNEIKDLLKRLPNDERVLLLQKLKYELEVEDGVGDELSMLSWDEIREMSKNRISFGGHTLNHPILSNLSLQEAKDELTESKSIIEERLKTPVYSFAYPNGQKNDFNEDIKNILAESGYKVACTTIFGKNNRNTDPLELRRIYTSGNSLLKFAWRLRKAQ